MDPQATWIALIREWSERNWLDVSELAESLLDWLADDGFPPKTLPIGELGAEWHRVVAGAVASFALKRANSVLESEDGIPMDVPFTLCCASCNNEGPPSYAVAKASGWTSIQYTPAMMSDNFLGRCPLCTDKR